MGWYNCDVKVSRIYRQVSGALEPFSIQFSVSIEAESLETAESAALSKGKKRAFSAQHAKLIDQGQDGNVEVIKVSGPFNEPKYPLGTKTKWSKMSESY